MCNTESTAESEIYCYRHESCANYESNPLDWWKLNQHRFPLLARLAWKYLGIPATSTPSERMFSTAGQIVTNWCANLKPSLVDKLLFLNKNMDR